MRPKWLNILKKFNFDSAQCPECSTQNSIKYRFVADPLTKIGFLNVWCVECRRGVIFSRIKVPDKEIFVDMNSEEAVMDPCYILIH
jgi:Zn ribbon nucleic-acid-binding protein